MSDGYCIVSRNVGQTTLLVKEKLNGKLAAEDSPKGLAQALAWVIEHPELHQGLMQESQRLIAEVHTPEAFIRQIENFWDKLHQNQPL
jgi:glycosyltransferase involved in cell wall biosynthesis